LNRLEIVFIISESLFNITKWMCICHSTSKRWRSKLLFNLFDRLVIVQHQITQVIKNFRCLLIMLVLITESIYRWLYCIPNIMLYESCMLIMVRKSRERVGKIVLIHPYNSNQQYGILMAW